MDIAGVSIKNGNNTQNRENIIINFDIILKHNKTVNKNLSVNCLQNYLYVIYLTNIPYIFKI